MFDRLLQVRAACLTVGSKGTRFTTGSWDQFSMIGDDEQRFSSIV